MGGMGRIRFFERIRFDSDAGFACLLAFPVLLHPRFPTFAGGGIAARERQASDIGVRNGYFRV